MSEPKEGLLHPFYESLPSSTYPSVWLLSKFPTPIRLEILKIHLPLSIAKLPTHHPNNLWQVAGIYPFSALQIPHNLHPLATSTPLILFSSGNYMMKLGLRVGSGLTSWGKSPFLISGLLSGGSAWHGWQRASGPLSKRMVLCNGLASTGFCCSRLSVSTANTLPLHHLYQPLFTMQFYTHHCTFTCTQSAQ